MPYKVKDISAAMAGTEPEADADTNAPDASKTPRSVLYDPGASSTAESESVETILADGDAEISPDYAARVSETGEHYTPSLASQDMVSRIVTGELSDTDDIPTRAEIASADALETARFNEWLNGPNESEPPLATARGMAQVLTVTPADSPLAAQARGILSRIASNTASPADARTVAADTIAAHPAPVAPTANPHDHSARLGYVQALCVSLAHCGAAGSETHTRTLSALKAIAADDSEPVEVRNVARLECGLELLPVAPPAAERPTGFDGDVPAVFSLPWNEYETQVLASFTTAAQVQDAFAAYRTHHGLTGATTQ